MNNLLRLLLLFAVSLTVAGLPAPARAASGDYVSLSVPDLAQAVGFFHDVMNCDVIAQGANLEVAPDAMLDCGDGTTVELVHRGLDASPAATSGSPVVISFATDDAIAATAWLRANHVVMRGQPLRIAEGMDREKIVVEFLTPWGQPIQLVSHGRPDDDTTGTRLAVQ